MSERKQLKIGGIIDGVGWNYMGWNAVTSNPGGLANYSRTHLSKSDLYPLKKEFLEVVKGLWESYEDDAFICDREKGIFPTNIKRYT